MSASFRGLTGNDLIKKLQDPDADCLYTKELLVQWDRWLNRLNIELQPTTVRKRDVYGYEKDVNLRGLKDVVFSDTYQLAFPGGFVEPECDEEMRGAIIRTRTYFPRPVEEDAGQNLDCNPEDCCNFGKNKELYEKFRTNWEQNGKFYQQLKDHLEKHAKNMVLVKDIICFALGRLKFEEATDAASDVSADEPHIARSWLQHVAAMAIRDILQRVQGTEKINLCVQDPAYCANCKIALMSQYKFAIYDSPTGFEHVDEHTFIVTKAPIVPVRQIVGDLTAKQGGPAGILCDPIEDDYLNLSCPFLDPPSGKLWKFKKQNEELELLLDDTKEFVSFDNNLLPAAVFDKVGIYLKKKM